MTGLPSNGYPTSGEQVQPSYPSKPSPQPSYPSQNVYPSGYPQQPSVPDYGAQQPNAYPEYVNSGYPVPSFPNGPQLNYPQPGSPSGYSGYFELYPGQNQVYPGQPEFAIYPTSGDLYPYNGNINGYPDQQFAYPALEKKAKSPQVTTPEPSSVSSLKSGSSNKYNQKPSGYISKPSSTELRVIVPNQPESNDGQKAVVLGKNDLISPYSGSSGYSSSLTPQYVNSPTKAPVKTQYPTGQESNLVILSSSKPEASTPVYSVTTKSATDYGNSLDYSTTPSYEEQFSTLSPDSTTPVNVIPYPVPIVPNPGSCPCYFVPPTNNSTDQQPQQQPTFDINNLPKGAVIGFIPVVFYPSCGAASKEVLSSKLEPIFPSAYQVPYKCSYCEQSESQTATIKNSFDQVIKQSELSPTVVIKSPSRKNYPNAPIFDQQEFGKKIKVSKRKSKDEQN